MTALDFLVKLSNSEEFFDSEELLAFISGEFGEVVSERSERSENWGTPVTTVCKVADRYVALDWYRLNDKNSFVDQPYLVKKIKKRIVVTRYIPA